MTPSPDIDERTLDLLDRWLAGEITLPERITLIPSFARDPSLYEIALTLRAAFKTGRIKKATDAQGPHWVMTR
jgi:hypothetical protein